MAQKKGLRKAYLYQRFSSSAQIGNSSEDRQLYLQNEWLKNNSEIAELAEVFLDEALSASTGAHLAKGELGVFLTAVEKGQIPEGSFLLVENISRLTRLKLSSSQKLISKLWDGGITIVTVSDGTLYEPEDGENPITMSRLFFEFDRYYKEIDWHKKKISYSYDDRFNLFEKKGIKPKMRRPFWLDQDGELIEEQVTVVERMFELYIGGKGQVLIDRTLKEEFPDNKIVESMNATSIVRWITSDIAKGYWRGVKMFDSPVTPKDYLDANDEHTRRYKKHKNVNPKRLWPLSGLFRCGHCMSSRDKKEHSGMTIQQTANSLPVIRCSHRQRKGSKVAECAKNGEPTTFPYILAHWFFVQHVQRKALKKFTRMNSDAKIKDYLKEINIEIFKNNKQIELLKVQLRKLLKENKSIESLSEILSECETENKKLDEKQTELNYQLEKNNKFLISPEASGLIDSIEKFNSTMHQISVEIFIKDQTLYYEGQKGFEYLGYCKKTKEYQYFDHIYQKRKCPVPLPPDVDMLLMGKVLTADELASDHSQIDASFLMQMF